MIQMSLQQVLSHVIQDIEAEEEVVTLVVTELFIVVMKEMLIKNFKNHLLKKEL
jgi:hypothetical protein